VRTLYRVERVHGEELSFPVPYGEAIDQLRERIPKEPVGEPLRVVRIDYELDPNRPPTIYTRPMLQVWRATILKFPDVGTMGVYVCKDSSQHRYGNAGDWGAPDHLRTAATVQSYLQRVADWQVREARAHRLPISQVIVFSEIWTPEQQWHPYTGNPHAVHVHTSASPLIDTDRPCGEV